MCAAGILHHQQLLMPASWYGESGGTSETDPSGGKFTRIVACSQAGYALALALPSLQSAWSDVVASALVGAVGFSAARAVAVLSTASRSDAGAERRACVAVASYATAASAAALGTAANAGALLGLSLIHI